MRPDAPPLGRRVAAEGLGAFFLFACVIGSGIMAAKLSGGNDAIALLGNTLATGAILFVLITVLGPISGAHMNPAVSLVAASRGELGWGDAAAYITAADWFTSSTSFANPAITVARSLTDTFAGIAPHDVLPFIAAQLLGAGCAAVAAKWLFDEQQRV
jgi:glycerol uptake facilitator-like aquaporin